MLSNFSLNKDLLVLVLVICCIRQRGLSTNITTGSARKSFLSLFGGEQYNRTSYTLCEILRKFVVPKTKKVYGLGA